MQKYKYLLLTSFILNILMPGKNLLCAKEKSTQKTGCLPVATQLFSEIFQNSFGTLPHEILVKKEKNRILKIPYNKAVKRQNCDLGHSTITKFTFKKLSFYKLINNFNEKLNIQFLIKENDKIFHIRIIKTAPIKRNDNFKERYLWYIKSGIDPCLGKITKKNDKIIQAVYFNNKNSRAIRLKDNLPGEKYPVFNPLVVTGFILENSQTAPLLPASFKNYIKKAASHSRIPERKFEKMKEGNYTGLVRYYYYPEYIESDDKRGGL